MKKWFRHTAMTMALALTAAVAAAADAGSIRNAAARNLALFQSSQKHWFEVQRCDSCHHQYQPALAYRAAREHGIPFDETIARADAAKAFTYADLDKVIQYSWIIEPAVDDAYRLIAADAAGVRPSLSTAVMARILMARQNRGVGAKPILELNMKHALVRAVGRAQEAKNESDVTDLSSLLFEQAQILDGEVPDDPAAFAARLNRLVVRGLGT